MARSTADLEDRASWNQLAERWLACASQFEDRMKAAQASLTARRSRQAA